MPQRHAIQKLHGDKSLPVLVVNLVDGADIGMIQCRGSFRFPLKAAERLLIFGYLVGQELEGHKAAELNILGLIDDPHPATTELLDDAVVRNGLANHVGEESILGATILGANPRQVNGSTLVWWEATLSALRNAYVPAAPVVSSICRMRLASAFSGYGFCRITAVGSAASSFSAACSG